MSINNKNEINHSDSFIFSKHPGLKTKDALDNLYYEILKFKNDICKKYVIIIVLHLLVNINVKFFSTFIIEIKKMIFIAKY